MSQPVDTVCRSVMSAAPVTLHLGDTLAFGLRSLVKTQLPALPVVDDAGRYVGMLPRSRLIALAMPHVLAHNSEKYSPEHLLEIGFVQDSLADLQARLDAVAKDPVQHHLDTDVPVMAPSTPLTNTMLFLHRQRNILPVVEDGKLVGIVSVWDVLGLIGRVE